MALKFSRWQGPNLTKKDYKWPPWPEYFHKLSEKLTQPRNYYLHPVCWTQKKSKKLFGRYQGDKVLIWRKKVKDGRNDPNIFPNFLKNWCSLGINTCIQYVEHQMNWKSGFVDIRVTWMWGGVHAQRRRQHALADETIQKLKARGSLNKSPPPHSGWRLNN